MIVAEGKVSEQSSSARKPKSGSIGAVVVGGDYQGLGIVRSLGRKNIPVCVIDDEHSIARYSRYATHFVRVKSLRDEKETVDALLSVGRRLNLHGWVLYPTRDETVAAFARYRSDLEGIFRVPTPDWTTVKWIWDKRNTYCLAARLGVPTPATWYPKTVADLDLIDKEPPYAIKPAIKEHFFYATRAKAWRANTRAELKHLFHKASKEVGSGEVMVQDIIPGDGRHQFAYCAFFKSGNAIGSMLTRRTRQHPREFGRASTFVETLDVPGITDASIRFLREISYYGLVEMEYKFDARDEQYKLLDVNGRTWGYHSLGCGAGVDFPYLLFSDVMGEQVEACTARTGVSWVRLTTDLPMGLLDIVQGRQNVRGYLHSLKQADLEAVFCRDDPAPAVAELALLPYIYAKRAL